MTVEVKSMLAFGLLYVHLHSASSFLFLCIRRLTWKLHTMEYFIGSFFHTSRCMLLCNQQLNVMMLKHSDVAFRRFCYLLGNVFL